MFRRIRRVSFILLSFILSISICSNSSFADVSNQSLETIANASIQDLLNMTVTTVSKTPEDLRTTSAPVAVLTGEEIRRSGATSVPDALRRIPGVNVAKIDSDKWAVSIRGFNGRVSNKLLVMVDGRSIYEPALPGTIWETRDVPLSEIDKIEVVRGPGGSAWGANAMNGVINIITKSAKDTQGTYISTGGGTEERAFSDVKYGGKVSDSTFYRVYSRYYNRDNSYPNSGTDDDAHNGQGGFRIDSTPDKENTYMLAGNIYKGAHDGPTGMFDNVYGEGGSLQGRWSYAASERSHFVLNSYYDHLDLDAAVFAENREIGEVNLQNDYKALEWLNIISFVQYRYTTDSINNSSVAGVNPEERDDNLISGSLSGKAQLIKDILELRAGTKLEHNDYSDWEIQPDIGISWSVIPSTVWWSSVSRAVRTPSRFENDLFVTFPDPGTVVFTGNRSLDSEKLIAYQTGVRSMLSDDVLLGLSTFYNDYSDLSISETDTIRNDAHGNTYGAELGLRWNVTPDWSLTSGYSLLQMDMDADAGKDNYQTQANLLEGNSPEHQVHATSRLQVNDRWQFDVNFRYVDRLKEPNVDSYMVADVRVGYEIIKGLDCSIVGQNLFDNHHFEQGGAAAAQVQQGVYGKITWRY